VQHRPDAPVGRAGATDAGVVPTDQADGSGPLGAAGRAGRSGGCPPAVRWLQGLSDVLVHGGDYAAAGGRVRAGLGWGKGARGGLVMTKNNARHQMSNAPERFLMPSMTKVVHPFSDEG